MLPRFPFGNPANCWHGEIIQFGNALKLPPRRPQHPNCKGITLGDLCSMMFGTRRASARVIAENPIGMKLIFGCRAPFQVVRNIVGRITIFVIYLCSWKWGGAYKRSSDKPMNLMERFLRLLRKTYAEVSLATLGNNLSFRFANMNTTLTSVAPRTYTANPAQVADFIYPFKSTDRSPRFHAARLAQFGFVCQGGPEA